MKQADENGFIVWMDEGGGSVIDGELRGPGPRADVGEGKLGETRQPTGAGFAQSAPPEPVDDVIELIDDEEIEEIGDLGNDGDDPVDLDAVVRAIETHPPSRLGFLMHRASECIRALKDLRAAKASPWPEDRVPEEHWRALADEALGLIGVAAKKEIDDQTLLSSLPKEEQQDFQRLLDSSLGMRLFSKAFHEERAAWEKAFWRMALDQSFGKRPWTGPQGWRVAHSPGSEHGQTELR